jgi:hypothetical protein
VSAAIRSLGAKLFFLPPYSPDLNPIEMVFAKLKTLLRKADERTIQATWPSHLEAGRQLARRLQPRRMRGIPPACRVCFSLDLTDSSTTWAVFDLAAVGTGVGNADSRSVGQAQRTAAP